jgi:hypothetical protein
MPTCNAFASQVRNLKLGKLPYFINGSAKICLSFALHGGMLFITANSKQIYVLLNRKKMLFLSFKDVCSTNILKNIV